MAYFANSIDRSQKLKQLFIICIEELLVGEPAVSKSSRQVPNCKWMTLMNRNAQAVLDMNMHHIPLFARSNPLFLVW